MLKEKPMFFNTGCHWENLQKKAKLKNKLFFRIRNTFFSTTYYISYKGKQTKEKQYRTYFFMEGGLDYARK